MITLTAERARWFLCVALALALAAWGRGEAAEVRNQLALAKCRLIVQECYPDSGMYPWCGTLVAAHEEWAEKKGAPDFAAQWFYSLAYSGANFSCRVGATAPGLCSGPMDCKARSLAEHRRLTRDTEANIRHHTAEAWVGWSKGYRGLRNCYYVFLPRDPRDWGKGKIAKAARKHRTVIAKAYSEGRL